MISKRYWNNLSHLCKKIVVCYLSLVEKQSFAQLFMEALLLNGMETELGGSKDSVDHLFGFIGSLRDKI